MRMSSYRIVAFSALVAVVVGQMACTADVPVGTKKSPKPKPSSGAVESATPTPGSPDPLSSAAVKPSPKASPKPSPAPSPVASKAASAAPSPSVAPSPVVVASSGPLPEDAANLDVSTFAGTGDPAFLDGEGVAAAFDTPESLAADGNGNLFVADTHNYRVRKIVTLDGAATVSVLAGAGGVGGSNNADPLQATFDTIGGLAIAANGDIYLSDVYSCRIRRIAAGTGEVSTVAGSTRGFGDGPGSTARFTNPAGLAISGTDLFVADEGNHRIRRIDISNPAQPTVSTYAGSGVAGETDGTGANALFNGPHALAIDAAKNLYVLETLGHRIRQIDATKLSKPFAGSGEPGMADGPAAGAKFNFEQGGSLFMTTDGVLIVADAANQRVRRVKEGVVGTYAGSANPSNPTPGWADGAGDQAKFFYPRGVVVGADGLLYVSDAGNHRIRKVVAK